MPTDLHKNYTLFVKLGFMSALVPNWGWYAAARFVVGVGYGSNMVVACVYPLEFVGRQWRVLCGTLGLWSPGVIALAGLVSVKI